MPTLQNASRGQVVQIWGKAYIRGADGVWRPLSLGETVAQGAEILTEQNAIVMLEGNDMPLPVVAQVPSTAVDRAIAGIENNTREDAPAAGLAGGGGGDMQPALRVDRIVESVTATTLTTGTSDTAFEFGTATRSDPSSSLAVDAGSLLAASSSIAAVEAGSSVNLGLLAPSGAGASVAALTVTVTGVPTLGQVFTAAGVPVVAGSVLGVDDLAGLRYVPPADYMAGTPVGDFAYRVSNGTVSASGGTQIAVTPVNDAPLGLDASAGGGEDILLPVSLLGVDGDGGVASVTVTALPAHGTLLRADTFAPVAAGAVLTPAQAADLLFRPNAQWNGSTSLSFTVTDDEGAVSAPASLQIQITAVNDAPLAVADNASTVAQAPVTVAVLGNDSDVDDSALSVTGASVSALLGNVVVNGNGTLTFTAAAGVTGPVVVAYTVADPSGATSSATLTVNVAAAPTVSVNVPALSNDNTPLLSGSSNLPAGSTVTLTVTDAAGAVQTFTAIVQPDGNYSAAVPAPLAEGAYAVVAAVTAPSGSSASANDSGVIDITPHAITVDAPALTGDNTPALSGSTDLPAGSTVTLTVTDANGAVQIFATTVQPGGSFGVDVPAALTEGPFTVTARGTDAAGNTASAVDNGVVDLTAPSITVAAPTLTNDITPTLTGTTDLPAGATITLTVGGADGAAQTFSTTVLPGGSFSVGVPAALAEGPFSVIATGTDAAGNTASANDTGVVDITPPVITVDAPALTNDSTPSISGTTDLPPGSTVTLTVTGANGAVQTFSTPVLAGGTFSVAVPAALVEGSFDVVASGTDAAGNSASATDSGVIDVTAPSATLTIDPITADDIVNGGEASGMMTLTGTVGGDVQVGDIVTLTVNGVAYSGAVAAGNTFAIAVPGAAVLADADRRIDGSVTTIDAAGNSTTATAQRPYAVNTAPIAVADALSVGEDAAAGNGDVTPGSPAQDRDADGDTLSVTGVAAGVQPSASGNVNTPIVGSWGTLLLDGLGAYTYVPSPAAQALDAGQTVSDTFTYTIDDGRGGSATATLTISVVGADDPTTIAGVMIGTVAEDAVASASGALTNGDPDVGTRAFVVQSNSTGTYGSFSIDAGGHWTYTLSNAAADVQALALGQIASETFIVATDDGTTASITVTVEGANDAPVVSSTAINAVEEGAPVALGLAVPADIDNGAVLTITVTGLPAIGQVQLADGTPVANGAALSAAELAGLRYLPPAEHDGVAPVGTFSYEVSDGIATVAGGTTISVAPSNDAPLALDVAAAGTEDGATRIEVTLAGSDVDGTVVSYTITSLPAGGDLYAAASGGAALAVGAVVTGPVFFMPAPDFNGDTAFDYAATDNGGAVSASAATATISIAPVVDPAISIDDVTVNEAAGTVTFTVTLDQPTSATVTVNYATSAGSATDGADYSGGSGTLSFAAGVTTQTITLPIADDGTYEGAETFSVLLTGAVNGVIADGIGLATIRDDGTGLGGTDDDRPTIAVSSPAVGEGSAAVFTVSLSNPSTSAVTFAPSLASGSATVGADTSTALEYFNGTAWLAVPLGGVTIAAGDTSVSVRVATSDDFVAEGSETFDLVATVTAGTTANPSAVGTATIGDDSDAVSVSLSASPAVAEGGTIVYTAALTQAAVAPLSVTLSNGAVIAIAAGATSGSVSVAAPSDDVYVNAGGVAASIASSSGGGFEALVIDPAPATTTVGDTIDSTTVSITGDASVGEGATAAYTVSLTSPAQTTVTVNLAYSGTASDGSDFAGAATVTIPAGASSASLNIAALQDVLGEGSEAFTVAITSASGGNFEALAISASNGSQTTQIVDDDTPSLSVSAPTVGEGGLAVFTVSLSNPSAAAVTFDPVLASGSAVVGIDTGTSLEYFDGAAWLAVPGGGLTIAAGSTSVQVRVATTDDAAAEGNETFSLIAHVSAGLTANASASDTATISDDVDAASVALSASPSVAEGGSIVYTATLSSAAVTPMTVTLSTGQAITIAAGATSGSVSIAAPGDDPYLDAGSVSRTIASTSGGSLEAVSIDGSAAVTTVSDTLDTTTATLTATPGVSEGGTITYTVSLGAPGSGSDVTVVLANGQTVTIPVGMSSASVTAIAPDDVYGGVASVSNAIVSASGGNFEQLTPDTTAVSTAVTDAADATTVSLTATPSVAEGGSISYTATLTSAAQSPVTVTLSNGAVITVDAGATTGSASVDAPGDDPYVDASIVSATISTATGGGFENLQVDAAAATTSVTDDSDVTSVSLGASASVAEGGAIVYTVTLSHPAQSAVAVTLSTGEVIDIAAGASAGSITLAAPADDVYAGGGSVSRTIAAAAGGSFESLLIDATPAATAVNDTIDTTTVSITGSSSVAEGATAAYTVSLTSPAAAVVTVLLAYSGSAADGVDFTGLASVTIPAGASSAALNIATLQDALGEGAESFTVAISSVSGGNFEALAISAANGSLTTQIVDDDTPSLSVSSPTVGEGGVAVFTVALSNPSGGAVSFTPMLASGTATVGADTGTALEFFDGSSWQPVSGDVTIAAGQTSVQIRVATVDDFAAEGSEAFTLGAVVSAGLTANASATGTATISDDIDATSITLSATPSVAEGGTITYTATLSTAAVTPMAVTLSTGQVIEIAAGASSGSLSIPAPADDPHVDAGNVSRSIASVSGGGLEAVSIDGTAAVTSVTDTPDVTTATLSASPTVAEGGSIVYTATLSNAAQAPVTVSLSSGQTITIAAGSISGSISIAAPGDDPQTDAGTVSRSITSASGGNFEALVVDGAAATTTITDTIDTTTLSLTGAASVAEGASASYTLSLTSAAQTPLTVTLAYSGSAADGSDYSGVATVTIAAGSSSASFDIATLDDSLDQIDAESFTVSVASTSGGNFENLVVSAGANSVTSTIVDNDAAPTLSVSSPSVAEGGGFVVFTVALSHPSSAPVSVDLALDEGSAAGGGTDYGAPDATRLQVSTDGGSSWSNATAATFAAGATSLLVRTPLNDDTLDESDETFTLTAAVSDGSTSNASAVGTATILDEDAEPTLAIGEVSVDEGAGTMTFTVELSAASGRLVTVDYSTADGSAGAGSDYAAASGTLSFAPGQVSRTITVAIVDDTLTESGEAFTVALSGAVNATIGNGSASGTIVDNDTPPLGRDATVTTLEDTAFAFSPGDFLMNDAEQGNDVAASAVRIDSLPTSGTLLLGGTPVVAGQVIAAASLGTLTFVPAADANGSAYASFTFTVQDVSGKFDSAPNAITIHVTAVNDAPVVGNATAIVSEEGLSGANADAIGSTDTTNALTASGTLPITDIDNTSFACALLAPSGSFTSGGAAITWSGSGTATLVGAVGSTIIVTATIDAGGAYSVTLSGAIDHAGSGSEDVITLPIGVQIDDGNGGVATSTLSVRIEDDSPLFVSAPDAAMMAPSAGAVLVGDLHLALGADAGSGARAQFSGTSLDADGFITGTHTGENGSTVTQALTYNGLKLTYVAGATAGSLIARATDGTDVYTVTPISGGSQYTVTMLHTLDAAVYTAGTFGSLAAGNTAGTYVYGDGQNRFSIAVLGTSAGSPGTVNTNNGYFGVNNNFIDQDEQLSLSFDADMQSIALKIDNLSSGESMAWKAYDENGALVGAGTIAGTGSGGSNQVASITSSSFTGGDFRTFTFEAGTASTSYRVGLTGVSGNSQRVVQTTTLGVTGVDADGDSSAAQGIALTFDRDGSIAASNASSALAGGAGNEALVGGSGVDHISGGGGNDALTGGGGADVFVWHLADKGSPGSPAIDTIADFNAATPAAGGDVLDLRDLLQGETTANLQNYLDFSVSGGTTTLRISSSGGFAGGVYAAGAEDERIALTGVDIRSVLGLGASATDTQIIDELINRGKLLTDA